MPRDEDKDKTPVEPLMGRKRSSQQAMIAIGWKDCPACMHEGKIMVADCKECFDIETNRYDRRLPPDKYIAYLQKEEKSKLEVHDTEPAMAAVKPPPRKDPRRE